MAAPGASRDTSILLIPLILLVINSPFTAARLIELPRNAANDAPSSNATIRFNPSKSRQLYFHPRIFLYEGFLSDEECEALISMARDKAGSSNNSNVNSAIILPSDEDVIVSNIEDRISSWTFLPKENGEDLQILRYGVNESSTPGISYNQDSFVGDDKCVTVLMYLLTVDLGGETVFPKSKDKTLSGCAKAGRGVKPARGNALLIFNRNPDATPDETSLHGDCPVLVGEKWLARKYVHVSAYGSGLQMQAPERKGYETDDCTDEDDSCPGWAAAGECQRNPTFMVGSPDYYGACRKSCRVC